MNEAELEKSLRLDSSKNWQEDRAWELGQFLDLSEQETISLYQKIHEARKIKPPKFKGESHTDVVESINDPTRVKAHLTRQMLHYTRYLRASRVSRAICELVGPDERANFTVLDYGCGVADYGLAFALLGFSVDICDISGPKLDFAKQRFSFRGYPVGVRAVDDETPIPSFRGIDLVVSAELLEHVVNPLQVTQKIHDEINDGGLLWVSDFPMREKSVGGEHLESAASRRLECKDFMEKNFDRVDNRYVKYLFRKRK